MRSTLILGLFGIAAVMGGCVSTPDARDVFGKTYYIDGAGNWGFGVVEVARGLKAAGYPGSVEAFLWTTSFNPAIDQINRPAARMRALELKARINSYLDRYPDNDVNIIALSAGTGVAVWAIEGLDADRGINALVLLGSSLSSDYDMVKALPRIRSHVYVYYSPHDTILEGPVRILGTIDGKMGGDSVGLVGLHPPGGGEDRITNVVWSPEYESYGWTGAHTDCTSEPFVQHILAAHIMPSKTGVAQTPAGSSNDTPLATTTQPDDTQQ